MLISTRALEVTRCTCGTRKFKATAPLRPPCCSCNVAKLKCMRRMVSLWSSKISTQATVATMSTCVIISESLRSFFKAAELKCKSQSNSWLNHFGDGLSLFFFFSSVYKTVWLIVTVMLLPTSESTNGICFLLSNFMSVQINPTYSSGCLSTMMLMIDWIWSFCITLICTFPDYQ